MKTISNEQASFFKAFKKIARIFNENQDAPLSVDQYKAISILDDLVDSFQDKSSDAIHKFLEGLGLNSQDASVFVNYHLNLRGISGILTNLMAGNEPSRDDLRTYFFKGKKVNPDLLSSNFRLVLDYIQNSHNLAAKTELFSDMMLYFSSGAYAEDIKNKGEIKSDDPTVIFNELFFRSKARNVAVKIEKHPNGTFNIEAATSSNLNKSHFAKAGYIDVFKRVPPTYENKQGEPIHSYSLLCATGAGKLDLGSEALQPIEYAKAISYALLNNSFLIDNHPITEKQIKSFEFSILTSFTTEKKREQQEGLEKLGLHYEKFNFLNKTFAPFLKDPEILDFMKYTMGMNGIACQGIPANKLKSIQQFIIKSLDEMIASKNIDSKTLIQQTIVEAWENFAGFLNKTYAITDISKHQEIQKRLNQISELNWYKDVRRKVAQEFRIESLVRNFDPQNQLQSRQEFRDSFDKDSQESVVQLKTLYESKKSVQSDIDTELVRLGVDPKTAKYKIAAWTSYYSTGYNKPSNFTIHELLWIMNNKERLMNDPTPIAVRNSFGVVCYKNYSDFFELKSSSDLQTKWSLKKGQIKVMIQNRQDSKLKEIFSKIDRLYSGSWSDLIQLSANLIHPSNSVVHKTSSPN